MDVICVLLGICLLMCGSVLCFVCLGLWCGLRFCVVLSGRLGFVVFLVGCMRCRLIL